MSSHLNDYHYSRGMHGSGRSARGTSWGGYTPRKPWRDSSLIPDPIPRDLGNVIETISKDDFSQNESKETVVANVRCVASFNWIGGVGNPTIAIPGAPPRWSPPLDTPKLSEDSGTYYRDINAAYQPQCPMLATALAVLANPTAGTRSTDLVSCASILRYLFLFSRGERQTFRIMATAIGKTVVFHRREQSPREVIPDVYGYGHSMPESYTTWDSGVRGSVSNQRVIKYDFAGLECLVRYELDGYLPSEMSDKEPAPSSAVRTSTESSENFDIGAAMSSVNMSSSLPNPTSDGLVVKQAGLDIPQGATFELKTRSIKRKDEDFFAGFAARLWLTQTPHFILAFHQKGTFSDIRVRDVRKDVQEWEAANQFDINRFASLISWLVKQVRAKGVLELWRHESNDLQILTPRDESWGEWPVEVEDQWTAGDVEGVPL